jgi:7,8-dihydropterin-6-yl-methyl-4-(beta-D-ribofuranosyl)aminobenzene 5'-phosphate synthase
MADQVEDEKIDGSLSIHICCDNTSSAAGFETEWGFAAAIRLPNGSLWLFDAGQSGAFVANGLRMGIDFRLAKGMVLSHGHYDHTGGIPALLQTGFSARFHAHPGCTQPRYTLRAGNPPKPIGMPEKTVVHVRDLLTSLPPDGRLDSSLVVLSPIPRRAGLFQATAGFFLDPHGITPDAVEDDLALLLDSPQGPVLLLGCCHSGLANTLYAAGEAHGIEQVHAIIGGLHLTGAGTKAVEESAAVIEEFGVREVYAGHCTGAAEMQELSALLPGRVKPLGAGRVLSFLQS